ncbi:BQ5605_C004g02704 [Microbotryum silenes-dioicae]|uniref:BQ5605_C004g02704 protein n=1 Tax=Microbotryum silenes-dioicae TaxID=796604 RepID=A0A2X0N2M8_9BASI|nr:BQ5605_C004g02704 [Microbotryum silenes-dioicae]
MLAGFLGWLSDRHSEERTGASASVVHDKSSQPEWDDDWMPYFRSSKTEGATERIFDAAEFRNKNLHLKFPSVDWSEARLVGEGDPEWGMDAVPMTAEELQKHLDREEAAPAETPDIDPRRNRHLFADSGGNKWIRAGVVYSQELPPAYLKFKDQDGARRFYTKTVGIESRMTVTCTEDKPRVVTGSTVPRRSTETTLADSSTLSGAVSAQTSFLERTNFPRPASSAKA